jgi:hypothetical protein
MRRLEDAGAIEIETRGRLGAFLSARSVSRLWEVATGGPLVIALPLASSPRYEGLATAIKQVLTSGGLDVFLIFVRGSRQRLQALHDRRCHLAVMSSFAASEVCGPGDSAVVELLPESYNTGHLVFYSADRAGAFPLRVIVDRFSADQQLLTAIEFSQEDVLLIPAMTSQIARLLETGQADAAVWTSDEMQTNRPANLVDRPLSDVAGERVGDRDTRAVLVALTDDAPMFKAVTSGLDPWEIQRIQQDVMAGLAVAEY